MSGYCTRTDFTAQYVGSTCDGTGGCGHLIAAHIGVDHCGVCELVDLAARTRQALDAQTAEPTAGTMTVHVDSHQLYDTIRRHRAAAPVARPKQPDPPSPSGAPHVRHHPHP